MSYYLGIDPGKTGAIALLDARGCPVLLEDWLGDEIVAAGLLLAAQGKYGRFVVGALENVHSRPTDGVKQAFCFGRNFGAWLGLCAACGVPLELVTPQTWMKGVVFKTDGGKDASLTAARRLFPSMSERLKRKKDNGRADALLIARWLWLKHGGKEAYEDEEF